MRKDSLLFGLFLISFLPFLSAAEGGYTGFSFDTSLTNSNPMGITTDGTYFWILNNGCSIDCKVYKYWMNGTYTDFSFDLNLTENKDGLGITTDGTNIWITDNFDKRIYKYNMNGIPTGENFPTSGLTPYDILKDGEYFWITGYIQSGSHPPFTNTPTVQKYWINGTFTGEKFTPLQISGTSRYWITQNGDYLWLLDMSGAEVYKYYKNGTYTGFHFDTATSGNTQPTGITNNENYFWITDSLSKKVYQYSLKLACNIETEICDGLDNDCDGKVDEGDTCPLKYYYCDNDFDSYINLYPSGSCYPYNCVPSICKIVPGNDCDDNNAAINLGAVEICNNLDDNCIGGIDEGFGQTTCGLGVCEHTINNCEGGVERVCDPLEGFSQEICNNLDDDCDGQVDEELLTQPTTCGLGACAATGIETCFAGQWTGNTCVAGNPTGLDDDCNNIDDDCNGVKDEDYVSTSFTCGLGVCEFTAYSECTNGQEINTCTPEVPTGLDNNCNNLDEDCDGSTNEHYMTTSTTCGIGVCARQGQLNCEDGSEVDSCTSGSPTGLDNNCNGIDENCDGTKDDNYLPSSTSCGVGACTATGQLVCSNGATQDSCVAGNPGIEVCNNVDDNCDGQVDEGYNVGNSCSSGANSCGDINIGNIVCSIGGLSSFCSATIPVERLNWNKACTSGANSCGDTNTGLTDCNGICLATIPVAIDSDGNGIADCLDTNTDIDNDGIPDATDVCPLEDARGFDADLNGCIDIISGLQQTIKNLPNEVLSYRMKNLFILEIVYAQKALDRGQKRIAISLLKIFIYEVQSQKGKTISKEAADMLIKYSNNIISRMS
jgi:hypothetical protein